MLTSAQCLLAWGSMKSLYFLFLRAARDWDRCWVSWSCELAMLCGTRRRRMFPCSRVQTQQSGAVGKLLRCLFSGCWLNGTELDSSQLSFFPPRINMDKAFVYLGQDYFCFIFYYSFSPSFPPFLSLSLSLSLLVPLSLPFSLSPHSSLFSLSPSLSLSLSFLTPLPLPLSLPGLPTERV